MPSLPVLPFWPADYLGDTRHLTATEHGAFFLLLLAAWQSPDCSIPNEEKRLARMAACNLKQWRAVSDAVLGFWDLDEGLQKWTQKRLLKEHQKATLKSKQASLSAQARYLKSNDTGDANAERTHCERTATPSPSPSLNQKRKKEVPKGTSKESPLPVVASGPDGFDVWWSEYPSKKGKKAAEKSYRSALKTTNPETLLAGLTAFKAAAPWGNDLRYCAHPATWLNQGRWADEYETAGQDIDAAILAAAREADRREENGEQPGNSFDQSRIETSGCLRASSSED